MKTAEMIVDSFAGGGGASLGIERALCRPIDVAINHDQWAIAMHAMNHPHTRHLCEDVWKVVPAEATGGQPVGLLWASPDCKHFSKAKGGKPVSPRVRGLAWVVIRWAATVRPRVIILENVEEFTTWGPLAADGRPCPARKGRTFRSWVRQLEVLGYAVEWRELRACDYGAPTSRKRLFLIARCDGQPIVWPEPTHGPGRMPYHAAAECIDWELVCPSIFERSRPLADATLRRIAAGIRRYVIDAAEPFIVRICQNGSAGKHANSTAEPLTTVCTKNEHCLVVPHVNKYHGIKAGECRAAAADEPFRTLDTQNRFALVAAFLAKHYGGMVGHSLRRPVGTITAKDHHALVTGHLLKLRGTCRAGQDVREPMPTVTAGGNHLAEVRAFLVKYYATNIGQTLRDPMHTITSRHRLGLVTVLGVDYQIADIGMRMLQPRELARAQGFPDTYVLPGSKARQVAAIGNSVCPIMAEVLVRANLGELAEVAA